MDKIVFLEPVFCERIWGGRNLEKFDFSIPQGNIGEAWVIAAHDNGSSKITNGELAGLTLKEAYEKQPTLFTEKKYDKFPLLIKILDASDNLSVQVHPEDDYARENENGELGKTECWYVLDAKDLEGKTTVVFEDLYKDGKLVVSHNDLEDEDQTVYVPKVRTTAKSAATNSHQGEASKEEKIVDKVMYNNLVIGKEYEVKGKLMNKATGKPILIDGKEVTMSKFKEDINEIRDSRSTFKN